MFLQEFIKKLTETCEMWARQIEVSETEFTGYHFMS